MDNPPEVHTAQVVEQSAVELSNDQPNEVDNPGQANAVAALTEAFALQESDEHPLGDEIRRQVEYYFSDQNMATDRHLLALSGGPLNLPVALGEILGWKKMRRFKPRTKVVASLKKSTVLEVLDGNKTIRRRVPFAGTAKAEDKAKAVAINPKYQSDADNGAEEPAEVRVPGGYVMHKGVIRRMVDMSTKFSGMEQFFAESPITPEMHQEEKGLYANDVPLAERLEITMQRFFARRKLDYETTRLLNRFLTFGGVETRPRQFASTDYAALKEMDANERALALATHHIAWEKNEPDMWAIDFHGIAQAYLSSHYPISYRFGTEDEIHRTCKAIASFYNYLLYHNVCPEPEYRDDIMAARAFVEKKAPKELIATKALESLLPGPFSSACQYFFEKERDAYQWPELENRLNKGEGASVIFKTAIAALGSDDMFELVCSDFPEDQEKWRRDAKVTRINTGFEVVSIAHPRTEVNALYAGAETANFPLDPVGVMTCKFWVRDTFAQYDLPPGVSPRRNSLPEAWDLWLEGCILQHFTVGMKIEGTIVSVELCNSKIWFLEQRPTVYCSFYSYLLNELGPKQARRVKWYDEEDREKEDEDGKVDQPDGGSDADSEGG